jgi:hypothetical protein
MFAVFSACAAGVHVSPKFAISAAVFSGRPQLLFMLIVVAIGFCALYQLVVFATADKKLFWPHALGFKSSFARDGFLTALYIIAVAALVLVPWTLVKVVERQPVGRLRDNVTLSVATWNIRFGIKSDGSDGFRAMASLISRMDVDLLVITESDTRRTSRATVGAFTYIAASTGFLALGEGPPGRLATAGCAILSPSADDTSGGGTTARSGVLPVSTLSPRPRDARHGWSLAPLTINGTTISVVAVHMAGEDAPQ